MYDPIEYNNFADIYEIWTQTAPAAGANLPFYLEEYLQAEGPVVELGVGNGRIAIEAALQGKPIIGVDYSTEMLNLCRQRAQTFGVADKLTLIHADMRDFVLSEPAQLITIPFHSIGHLVTLEDKRAGVQHIYSQLAPGGRFIFDMFIFDPDYAEKRHAVPVLRAEYADPVSGQDVLLWVTTRYYFEGQSLRIITWTDELDEKGTVIRRRYRRLTFSWLYLEQARELLEGAGFEIEALYGGFDRRPFDEDSPEQVWVVRRPA